MAHSVTLSECKKLGVFLQDWWGIASSEREVGRRKATRREIGDLFLSRILPQSFRADTIRAIYVAPYPTIFFNVSTFSPIAVSQSSCTAVRMVTGVPATPS